MGSRRGILDVTRGLDIEGLYPILRIRTAVLEQRQNCVGYAIST